MSSLFLNNFIQKQTRNRFVFQPIHLEKKTQQMPKLAEMKNMIAVDRPTNVRLCK